MNDSSVGKPLGIIFLGGRKCLQNSWNYLPRWKKVFANLLGSWGQDKLRIPWDEREFSGKTSWNYLTWWKKVFANLLELSSLVEESVCRLDLGSWGRDKLTIALRICFGGYRGAWGENLGRNHQILIGRVERIHLEISNLPMIDK